MNTFQKLELIISYQDKVIQLAEKLERGFTVDYNLVTNLADSIQVMRGMLK